jgi:hypothetical protein
MAATVMLGGVYSPQLVLVALASWDSRKFWASVRLLLLVLAVLDSSR